MAKNEADVSAVLIVIDGHGVIRCVAAIENISLNVERISAFSVAFDVNGECTKDVRVKVAAGGVVAANAES